MNPKQRASEASVPVLDLETDDPSRVGPSSETPPPDPVKGLPLIAYALPDHHHVPIVPAPTARAWMLDTHKGFANRCLPLVIANQSGWLLLNTVPVRVTWDGTNSRAATQVEYLDGRPAKLLAASHFGYGILTWYVGYLFRTPPGYNLMVQGPSNTPKDGIYALQGIVETDWSVASFTMNWKLTRPNHPVTFESGEPFCMIVPQRRHELEQFVPRTVPIEQEPALSAQWEEFDRRRTLMIGLRRFVQQRANELAVDAPRVPFERHYFEGTSPAGWSAQEHQHKISLRRFETAADPTGRPPADQV